MISAGLCELLRCVLPAFELPFEPQMYFPISRFYHVEGMRMAEKLCDWKILSITDAIRVWTYAELCT